MALRGKDCIGKVKTDDRGVALVTLIAMLAVFGVVAVAVGYMLTQGTSSTFVSLSATRAFYLAEAGLNDSFWELKYGSKLYGAPGDPLGEIDSRSITFGDGASGSYTVEEPTNEIVATGEVGGVKRRVRVMVTNAKVSYTLYVCNRGNVTIDKNTEVSGNIFINGNVIVKTPTDIDTNITVLYLNESDDAHYSNGAMFPYRTLSHAPEDPVLNTSWYDSLLAVAATQHAGNETWKNKTIQNTLYIKGDLTIEKSLTTGGSAVVVVDGSVSLKNNATVDDSIIIISEQGINIGNNVEIGNTRGKSGNLLFSKSAPISIGNNAVVNGSVVSKDDMTIGGNAEVCGLVFCNGELSIDNGGMDVNGELWTSSLSGNTLSKNSKVVYNSSYISSALPPGVTNPSSQGRVNYCVNGWREL